MPLLGDVKKTKGEAKDTQEGIGQIQEEWVENKN
jgi:hypothetical protein